MAERKPPGMSTGSWVDMQIAAAMQEGAFDNLPGAGKPLKNIGKARDPDWWVKQFIEREGAHITPPALELRRKVERELDAIEKIADEAVVRERIAKLNAEIAKFNATVVEGPPTNLVILDIDQVVRRWRLGRFAQS